MDGGTVSTYGEVEAQGDEGGDEPIGRGEPGLR